MANTYIFGNTDHTVAQRSDGASIPWNTVANQPADISSLAGREWIADGSPIPALFVPPPKPPESPAREFIEKFTDAEYVLLEQKRAADIAEGKVGNAKNWDIVTSDTGINFASQKVLSLKADLVADSMLSRRSGRMSFPMRERNHAR